MSDTDAKLAALLSAPLPPDESFVARVGRAVLAETKIVAAQAALWRRFAAEAVGSTAIVAAFYLLWRMAPSEVAIDQLMLAPVIAASMLLFIWIGIALKPSATGK